MKLLVVWALDPRRPSGLPRLAEELTAACEAQGAEVVLLARDDLDETVLDGPRLLGRRTDVSLPAELFRHQGRDRLLFRLESEVHRRQIDRVLAFGVREAGYVASLAAHLRRIPFVLMSTYEDAFGHYLEAAVEVEACCASATAILAPNETVVTRLAAFQAIADNCRIVDPGPIVPGSPRAGAGPVGTTGALDAGADLEELTRFIAALGPDLIWRHIGFVEEELSAGFGGLLDRAGLAGRFEETGLLPPDAYRRALQECRLLVKARGHADTGASLCDALELGVPVSIHCEHPVRPEADLVDLRGRPFGDRLQRQATPHVDLESAAGWVLG
jgi:hypothetical protein